MPVAALLQSGDGTTPAPAYAVYKVNKSGAVLSVLSTNVANVTLVEGELNGAGACTVEMATVDAATTLNPLEHEIQVWREGRCIFWGPVVRVTANEKTTQFQARGLLWYFDRRYFGEADRTNLLANADFELGSLSSWTSSGPTSATAVSTHQISGTYSAKLVESPAGEDSYIYQNVVVTGEGVGTVLTLAAWFYLQDGGFLGGAFEDRGLFVEMEVGGSLYGKAEFSKIDAETPRNSWQRHEVIIHVPPNVTVTVNARLYAPGGTIFWDAVQLVKMESLSLYALDQASILQLWVNYAQDQYVYSHDKSNLLIAATPETCPETGVLRDEHQQFADHANIGSSLRAFTALDDGVDISVEQNGSLRYFHTWFPSKGTDRGATPDSGVSTVTISNAMVTAPFAYRFDGEQASNMVTVLGDGDGPDREEGAATNPSLFGSTTFEAVVAAQPGTPINRLDAKAAEELRALSNPASLTVTVHEPSANLFGTVVEGDIVKVDLDHGFIQVDGDYRVIAWRFTPGAETFSLELNAA